MLLIASLMLMISSCTLTTKANKMKTVEYKIYIQNGETSELETPN